MLGKLLFQTKTHQSGQRIKSWIEFKCPRTLSQIVCSYLIESEESLFERVEQNFIQTGPTEFQRDVGGAMNIVLKFVKHACSMQIFYQGHSVHMTCCSGRLSSFANLVMKEKKRYYNFWHRLGLGTSDICGRIQSSYFNLEKMFRCHVIRIGNKRYLVSVR